jgi:hypothetical protein
MDSAGAKSTMSNDMKELTEGKERITSEIRGHKANLANPSEFIPHQASFLLELQAADRPTTQIRVRNPRKTARRC